MGVVPVLESFHAPLKNGCQPLGVDPGIGHGAHDIPMCGPEPAQGVGSEACPAWIQGQVSQVSQEFLRVLDRRGRLQRHPSMGDFLKDPGEVSESHSQASVRGGDIVHLGYEVEVVVHECGTESIGEDPSQVVPQPQTAFKLAE